MKENPGAMRIVVAVIEFFCAVYLYSEWKERGESWRLYGAELCLLAGLVILYVGIRNLATKERREV